MERTRNFGGKIYKYYGWFADKRVAAGKARAAREAGSRARVTFDKQRRQYTVWIRYKRGLQRVVGRVR